MVFKDNPQESNYSKATPTQDSPSKTKLTPSLPKVNSTTTIIIIMLKITIQIQITIT